MTANLLAKLTEGDSQREKATLADQAYARLRADINRGRLAPNRRLRLEDLRAEYGIGFSPMREALMRLQSDGLVVLEQMKGYRVAPVSITHLRDLMRVRVEIESLALKWSIQQGDVKWEADVVAALHRLSKQSKIDAERPAAINEEWRREHRAFHAALIAACGSPLLASMWDSLFDQAERYVALSIRYLAEERNDVGEHEALVRAALDHDVERAVKLCADHIRRTTEKVIASSDWFNGEPGESTANSRNARRARGAAA